MKHVVKLTVLSIGKLNPYVNHFSFYTHSKTKTHDINLSIKPMRSETQTNLKKLSIKDIKTFLKQQKKAHFYKRIQFVQYKKEGSTHEEISKRLNICLKTISVGLPHFSNRPVA